MLFTFAYSVNAYCNWFTDPDCADPTGPCILHRYDAINHCYGNPDECYQGDSIETVLTVSGGCVEATTAYAELWDLYDNNPFECWVFNLDLTEWWGANEESQLLDGTFNNGDLVFEPGDPDEDTYTIHATWDIPEARSDLFDTCEGSTLALDYGYGWGDWIYLFDVNGEGVIDDYNLDIDGTDSLISFTYVCYSTETGQCSDGIDNDCDGQTDSNDPDCGSTEGCLIQSMSISPSCAGGSSPDCEQGETIDMQGTIIGNPSICTYINFLQIDANQQSDLNHGYCTVGIGDNHDMQGIFATNPDITFNSANGYTSYTISGSWPIPQIPSQCEGKNMNAGIARIYYNGLRDDFAGTTGSFSFYDGTPPQTTQCNDNVDNDGDGNIDWDGGGEGLPDTGCTDEFDDDETDCGDGVCELEEILTCPADCGDPIEECVLGNLYWSVPKEGYGKGEYSESDFLGIHINDATWLNLKGNQQCSGLEATFKIYECDEITADHGCRNRELIPEGTFTTTFDDDDLLFAKWWLAEYHDEGDGDAEYRIQATVGDTTTGWSLNYLEVINQEAEDCRQTGCTGQEKCCATTGYTCELPENCPQEGYCDNIGGTCCDPDPLVEGCYGNWIGGSQDCPTSCCDNICTEITGPNEDQWYSYGECEDPDGDGFGKQQRYKHIRDTETGQVTTTGDGEVDCVVIGTSVPIFTAFNAIIALLLITGYYIYTRRFKK